MISGLDQPRQGRGKRVGAAIGNHEIAACIGSGSVARTPEEHLIAGIPDQPARPQIAEAINDPIAEGKANPAIANNNASAGSALWGSLNNTAAEAAIDLHIGEQRRDVAVAREIGSTPGMCTSAPPAPHWLESEGKAHMGIWLSSFSSWKPNTAS